MTGRSQVAATEPVGVVFPVVAGRRSTTATGRGVFADAARAVAPDLAGAIEAEPDWRHRYPDHLRRLVEVAIESPAAAPAIAAEGLAAAYGRFRFRRGGEEHTLGAAMTAYGEPGFRTETVTGHGRHPGRFTLPYRGECLRGDALHRQLDEWSAGGVLEPGCAEAVRRVIRNPAWLELSDRTFAVLGAAAELGPLPALLGWGATVLAVDLPRREVWSRMAAAADRGTGRLQAPARAAGVPGADLRTDAPEVAGWLAGFDGPLVVGSYAYAHGGEHPRVAMAADAVVAELVRRSRISALAVIATPTDVYAVPAEVAAAARAAFQPGPLRRLARAASGGRVFRPSYPELRRGPDGRDVGIADGLVLQQGPNYALAKWIQRWRALVSRQDGLLASANIAPPTRTRSVLAHRALAAGYAGARRFGVEVFDPATSRMLMAALLVHDLREPQAAANPAVELGNPHDLFAAAAATGGLWRSPYEPRSVLSAAVLLGLATGPFQRAARPVTAAGSAA